MKNSAILQTMPLRFRVWDDEEKCWGAISSHQISIALGLLRGEANGEDDRYIISQDTGLRDKDGKRIYTGDIVDNNGKWTASVKYINGQITAFGGGGDILLQAGKLRIVGNIWQDPELLEEK